jgi:hypothetical protein
VGRLLLNYVLSDTYVDVALVGGHGACLGEPRFVELNKAVCRELCKIARTLGLRGILHKNWDTTLNNEISDDVASRIDLAKLHDRYVR